MDYEISGGFLELGVALSSSDLNVKVNKSLDSRVCIEFSGLRKNTIDEYFKVDFTNNKLMLKENKDGVGFLPFMNKGVKAEIVIEVPDGLSLSGVVSTVSGDLVFGDFSYSGKVESVSGDVFAGNIESKCLKLKTVSGDVNIASLKGSLMINGVSGDMKINDGVFEEIFINTVSGDIDLAGGFQLKKSGKINTVSGDIDLDVKNYHGDKEVVVNTLSGDVDIDGDFPEGKIICRKKVKDVKKDIKKELAGLKKSLKPLLNDTLKSTLGKLKEDLQGVDISFSEKSEKKAEKKVVAAESDEALVDKVLDMLAEGKINYEQAEKLINSLKG